jgi:AmmeMemoRadiSam system protein B
MGGRPISQETMDRRKYRCRYPLFPYEDYFKINIFIKLIILFVILLFLSACSGIKQKYFYSNDYYSANEARCIANPAKIPGNMVITGLPARTMPVSGTVSHHSLLDPVIDGYFETLRKARTVKTFIILCPKHFNTANGVAFTSFTGWMTSLGTVNVNKKLTEKIIKRIPKIEISDKAFMNEHGIGALTPFIKKYFPDANIVQICFDEKLKQYGLSFNLANIISEVISNDKEKIFLLISADFSHKAGLEETEKRDAISLKVLQNLYSSDVFEVNSDNSSGIYTLSTVVKNIGLKNNFIYCQTNSMYFTGLSQDDITSYFFTFQSR